MRPPPRRPGRRCRPTHSARRSGNAMPAAPAAAAAGSCSRWAAADSCPAAGSRLAEGSCPARGSRRAPGRPSVRGNRTGLAAGSCRRRGSCPTAAAGPVGSRPVQSCMAQGCMGRSWRLTVAERDRRCHRAPTGHAPAHPAGERVVTGTLPCHHGVMAGTLSPPLEPQGETLPEEQSDVLGAADYPWITIVWNDPINLMSYVTHVFMVVFGYSKPKAEKLMLDVHQRGKAVVSSGSRERMELDVNTLHGYGLWATLQH